MDRLLWAVENREWKFFGKHMDATLMDVFSTIELAEEWIRTSPGTDNPESWYCIYPLLVDCKRGEMLPKEALNQYGNMKLLFYDIKGNPMENQPEKVF